MRTRARIVVACLLLVAVPSCAEASKRSFSSERLDVVAAFYPVYEAATRIGADDVNVTNLTAAGVEPHDLELTSRSVDRVIDADVVLYLGHGFQPAVEETVRRATGTKVDLLSGVALRKGVGEEALPSDPHIWLDPRRWAKIVGRIEQALEEADRAHVDDYAQRGRAYEGSIEALHNQYKKGLASCTRHTIVTSHAAFGYLASTYGLEQVAITGISPEAEPSPKRIAEITDLVKREHITTVFTESLVSPRVADTLAREAGVNTAVLDPIEGLTSDEIKAGDDYVGVMQRNLDILRKALDCR